MKTKPVKIETPGDCITIFALKTVGGGIRSSCNIVVDGQASHTKTTLILTSICSERPSETDTNKHQ